MRQHTYPTDAIERYAAWISRIIRFHGNRDPRELGAAEIRDFVKHIAAQDRAPVAEQREAQAAFRLLHEIVLPAWNLSPSPPENRPIPGARTGPPPTATAPTPASPALLRTDSPRELRMQRRSPQPLPDCGDGTTRGDGANTVAVNGTNLLDCVRDAIRTLHYSIRTEDAYVGWITRFILFHQKRHPLEMAEPEINQFLTHLAVEGNVAASTQNQALSA